MAKNGKIQTKPSKDDILDIKRIIENYEKK